MGRHTAPRRRGPLVVTGATAGLLTASGLVVGFAPELGTHAADPPASVRAGEAPSAPAVATTTSTPTPTPSTSDSTPMPRPSNGPTRTTPDAGTASRSAPRSAPPTTSTATTSEKPTSSPTPSATEGGDLLGGLTGIPILP